MSDGKPIFRIDEAAILKGGEVGGQYLDSIGKTDLADLNRAQWTLFLKKVVGASLIAAIGDVYGAQIPF
jgi:hypothetical protein